jgi:hypothetical protein
MSTEELTAQLDALRIERDIQVAERDASIVGLVDAVRTYESTTESLKAQVAGLTAQVDELSKQVADKEKVLEAYKAAVLDQIRALLK